MTEQTEIPESSPRSPFAALVENLAALFPGYGVRTTISAGDGEDDDLDDEQARAVRMFALEQSIKIQTAAGASVHNPDVLDKAIILRAAKFEYYIRTGNALVRE